VAGKQGLDVRRRVIGASASGAAAGAGLAAAPGIEQRRT
jgi:hypothetical protein